MALSGVEAPEVTPMRSLPEGSQFLVSLEGRSALLHAPLARWPDGPDIHQAIV
jgi:hypothetical protein